MSIALHVRRVACVRLRQIKRRTLSTFPELKLLNSKISTLMRSGLVDEAEELFAGMPQISSVTFNAVIRGYFENGFFDKAVSLYNRMPVHDAFTCNTMISGLMRYGDVEGAELFFERMECKDIVTWNSLISGYFVNDRKDDAMRVFDVMPLKDVVSWNLVISGLVRVGESEKAEQLFKGMSDRDVVSWTIMLKLYLDSGRVHEARELFDSMPLTVKDVQAWNTILCGYVQNKLIRNAEGFFHKMPGKDMNSWNLMIDGYISIGRTRDALRLFNEMPDKLERTWKSILLGLVRNGLVAEAHALLEKSSLGGIVSWTNVMVGYFAAGEAADAMKVFESLHIRDTAVWNAAIFGLGENDHAEDGIKLLFRMKQNGFFLDESTVTSFLTLCSNLTSLNLGKQIHGEAVKLGIDWLNPVGNAFITMYYRCGSIGSALNAFNSMASRDIISWNSVICGLAHHGHGKEAIDMFEKMRSSCVEPNQISFVGVLSACSHAGLLQMGKHYFRVMQNVYGISPKNEHYTCMIDLLGRCGYIAESLDILNEMSREGLEVCDSIWGALFGASRMHKDISVAEIAGGKILELDPLNSGVYTILAEMHLAGGRREKAHGFRNRMKEKGVKKQPGCSWIESSGEGNVFLSGDKTHPEFVAILTTLSLIYQEMDFQNMDDTNTIIKQDMLKKKKKKKTS